MIKRIIHWKIKGTQTMKTNPFLIIMYLLFSILTTSLSSCVENENVRQKNTLLQSIEKIIEDGKRTAGGATFNFRELKQIEWDMLYIFGPYTPTSDIDSKLGTSNSSIKQVGIESRDDISLLVFLKQNEIKAVLPYPRQKADFSRIASFHPIFKKESFFKLVKNQNQTGWLYVLFDK